MMNKWEGKFVIGITGNIGTGKSVVRRMLEHLGAYGIDADIIGHRAIEKGAPGYEPVINAFGSDILDENGQIVRAKLAKIVFSSTEKLKQLEKIIHPLVIQAIDHLIKNASQSVVVIEAVKLLEAGIGEHCDSIWVTYASQGVQLSRLIEKRGMKLSDARRRLDAQSDQEHKVKSADMVIKNDGSFEETWHQVLEAWNKVVPSHKHIDGHELSQTHLLGEMKVVRGLPRHSAEIAKFLTEYHKGRMPVTQSDVMAAFGEKAFFLLQVGRQFVGLIGWQVENLVSRTIDIMLSPNIPVGDGIPPLIAEMENASRDLQCEVAILIIDGKWAKVNRLWSNLGYTQKNLEEIEIRAWQEAAQDIWDPEKIIMVKQLRKDRILRPI